MSSPGPFRSLPRRVCSSVVEILKNLVDREHIDDDEEEGEEKAANIVPKPGALKSKIQFVSKMFKMQKLLREEHENILKIKSLNNNKLPQGILTEGKEALDSFSKAKLDDAKNEMRPE